MLDHANLLVTAWSGDRLIGVARSVTDFHFCCYLSDLAVAVDFQRQGIGKELMRLTQAELGPRCTLILLSAPAAVDYYPARPVRASSTSVDSQAGSRPQVTYSICASRNHSYNSAVPYARSQELWPTPSYSV